MIDAFGHFPRSPWGAEALDSVHALLTVSDMEPKIEISPTGDLIFDHAFFRSTLVPSVERRHAESRADANDAYRSLFERTDEPVPPPEQFVQAVLAEYAMPFEAFLDVSGACANLAVEAGKPVLWLTRSRLVGWLGALPNFEGFDLEAAIDRITLPVRAGWDDLPVGIVASDFDFSRFDRHHSLIRRPIIAITTGNDPTLVVSPALIERAALHNLAGGIAGTLQSRFWASREMREFVGGAAERKGIEFNDKVAAFVRSLGPTAFASVKLSDALRHRGTDAVKRLGDIDVLALSSDGRHAWVIEAKDIRFCRTLNETTSRLSEYRGQTDAKGRRDNLRKHLDRVDYVRSHREDLAKRYGLSAVPSIHGLVVLDSPQPMAFVPNHGSPDAHFMMLPELSTLNWSPP